MIIVEIRNAKDLEDENTLYQINSTLDEDIKQHYYLLNKLSKWLISSESNSKECGDISSYTPLNVKGVWKSYIRLCF